jgi:DNA-binding transcriptional ArsR family regulator
VSTDATGPDVTTDVDPDDGSTAATAPDAAPPAGSRLPRASGRVLDGPSLKALAHPLRFQLLELLVEHGPSTASGLGRIVGENSGSTSYHLRQLEKHGLIEEAGDLGTARDRYWRVVEGGWTLQGYELLQQPDTAAAAEMVLGEVVRHRFERLQRWHEEAPGWGQQWANASLEATVRLRLTRDQLGELSDELVAVIDRYRAAQADDQPDTATVAVELMAFPAEAAPSPDDPRDETES